MTGSRALFSPHSGAWPFPPSRQHQAPAPGFPTEAYSAGSGLQGTPSPAVKVRVHRQEKVTATAARERDPQWNSPAMTFEVHSLTDVLEMEVGLIVRVPVFVALSKGK